jgi:hypothetical protein
VQVTEATLEGMDVQQNKLRKRKESVQGTYDQLQRQVDTSRRELVARRTPSKGESDSNSQPPFSSAQEVPSGRSDQWDGGQ